MRIVQQPEAYARQAVTPAPSSLVQGRIDAAIDRELAAKGWRKVESGADVHIMTHATRRLFALRATAS